MPDGEASSAGRLEESEQRYQTAIENASDMIQSCLPDGRFEFVNRAWREKLGYSAEEVATLTVWDIVHPDSLDHCMELFMRASAGESVDNVEAIFVTKDGRPLPVEGNATSRFLDGSVIATHSFFRDVSERQRAQELEARNQELEREHLIRSLEKMAALGKVAAGLAHELNNPAAAAQRAADRAAEGMSELQRLTVALASSGLGEADWVRLDAIARAMKTASPPGEEFDPLAQADREDAMAAWLEDRGVAEAWQLAPELVRGGLDEAQASALAAALPPATLGDAFAWLSTSRAIADLMRTVSASTHSISDLVKAVKDYSYMDRAPEQEVDIHDGLETTLRILGHKLKAGVTVVRDYDRTLPPLMVPGGELNQVWTNLIDNAIDACVPGGEVQVRTYASGDRAVVEIIDNGSGIPADVQPRIFETFFTTKGRGQGSGLGLEVVHRVVTQLCGGEIDFESEPGRTRFRVALPMGRPEGGSE